MAAHAQVNGGHGVRRGLRGLWMPWWSSGDGLGCWPELWRAVARLGLRRGGDGAWAEEEEIGRPVGGVGSVLCTAEEAEGK